jgi:hypothetical protein
MQRAALQGSTLAEDVTISPPAHLSHPKRPPHPPHPTNPTIPTNPTKTRTTSTLCTLYRRPTVSTPCTLYSHDTHDFATSTKKHPATLLQPPTSQPYVLHKSVVLLPLADPDVPHGAAGTAVQGHPDLGLGGAPGDADVVPHSVRDVTRRGGGQVGPVDGDLQGGAGPGNPPRKENKAAPWTHAHTHHQQQGESPVGQRAQCGYCDGVVRARDGPWQGPTAGPACWQSDQALCTGHVCGPCARTQCECYGNHMHAEGMGKVRGHCVGAAEEFWEPCVV